MKRSIFTSPLFLLKSVASVAYITIGILLLIKPEVLTILDKIWSRTLGIILLAYGLFRAWRAFNDMRESK